MNDDRYSRQILFERIGADGQARISRAHAVVVGCGALGSTIANTLARAGVGRLTLIDSDSVELSNLQRQTLYDEAHAAAATPKAEAAAERLGQINAAIEIEPVVARLDAGTIAELVGRPDVLLDGTDNFPTRYLLNDYCVSEGLSWIYGGVAAAYGVAMPILPRTTPCLRCVFPEAPPPEYAPTADTVGILAPIAHLIASIEAAEALKVLSGHPEAIRSLLYTVDLWEGTFGAVRLPGPEPACPCCGQGRYDFLEASP